MRISKTIMFFTVIAAILAMLAMILIAPGDSASPSSLTLVTSPGARCEPGVNLLKNPSFETVGPNGAVTDWPANPSPNSAAANWTTHSSNNNAQLITKWEPSTKQPGGKMIHVIAGGNEGGVIQMLPQGLTKTVASVWVYVRKGYVIMQANGGPAAIYAKSTATSRWELLQFKTDGSTPIDNFIILNQDPQGGEFLADLASVTCIDARSDSRTISLKCQNPGTHQDVAKDPDITNITIQTLAAGKKIFWSASDGDSGSLTLSSPLAPGKSVQVTGQPGQVYTCKAWTFK
ncbi:MAG TPA: hypothetical protein VIG25_02065 [Pyrinomonadaceae bacterium]|jgi:hypothetical protein